MSSPNRATKDCNDLVVRTGRFQYVINVLDDDSLQATQSLPIDMLCGANLMMMNRYSSQSGQTFRSKTVPETISHYCVSEKTHLLCELLLLCTPSAYSR